MYKHFSIVEKFVCCDKNFNIIKLLKSAVELRITCYNFVKMQTARPPKGRMSTVNDYPAQKPTGKTMIKTRIYDFRTANRTELLIVIDLCSEIDRTTWDAHVTYTRVKLAEYNAKNGRVSTTIIDITIIDRVLFLIINLKILTRARPRTLKSRRLPL